MNIEQIMEANLTFVKMSKPLLFASSHEIRAKLLELYQAFLKALFEGKKIFVCKDKVRKMPFNFRSFEFDYPTPDFLTSCLKKSVVSQNIGKIKDFLLVMNEIFDFEVSRKRKREIYYKYAGQFNDQKDLDEVIKELTFLLQINRSCIGVTSCPKGLVFGPGYVIDNDNRIYMGDWISQSNGMLIAFDRPILCLEQIRYVLVVEKETVFSDLLSQNCPEFFSEVLLITGRGYPDYLTKNFVKQILTQHPHLPIFYLGDFDPFGIDILMNYMFSTPLTVYENNNTPTIIPIGIDIMDLSSNINGVIKLSIDDLHKIDELLSYPFFDKPPLKAIYNTFELQMINKLLWCKNCLQLMKSQMVKAEVEILSLNQLSLIDYVRFKIQQTIDG